MSRFFFPVLIFFLVAFSCGKKHVRKETVPEPENEFAEFDFSMLENGDIILKRGKGSVSKMIANKLSEKIPLSHCGIVGKQKDSVFVIHSVAKELSGIDGVQKIEFNKFIKDCTTGLLFIVRLKTDAFTRNKIAENAIRYCERSVPFDYELNFSDSNRINCSELAYWSLLNATEKDFFDKIMINEKKALAFNSLLDKANFEIIYHY